jgi:hypothetical protein
MKKLLFSIFFVLSISPFSNTFAQNWVEIDDASKLLWQMQSDGVIWFRNLDEFDSRQGGCCYAYMLDTTTPGGKAMWSVILTKMASGKRITLGFPDVGSNANVQIMNYIGRHGHASNE